MNSHSAIEINGFQHYLTGFIKNRINTKWLSSREYPGLLKVFRVHMKITNSWQDNSQI